MARQHEAVVVDQFGPRANAYVASAVHAAGADLDRLAAIAGAARRRRALDLGAGGGHVSYRLAACCDRVTACDLSAEMMAAVAAQAQARGLSGIECCVSPAEALPFADASFDFAGCRFSAHHWRDLDAGLREVRRVLAPGAEAVLVDAAAPAARAADTHLQAVELLRDPSHVRNRTAAEWHAALGGVGLEVRTTATWRLRMEFASWVERTATPPLQREAIRALQRAASAETCARLGIEPDGSFMLDVLLLHVVR